MTDRRRFGGIPVIVYLTLLVLIPLLGLGILGLREVRRNADSASDARALAGTIEDQTTAIDVLAPLQVERITALGTVRIDELDIDLSTVDPVLAAQLLAMLSDNSDLLDRRLDAFGVVLADRDLIGLEATLQASRAEIDELRRAIDDDQPSLEDAEDVDEVYRAVVTTVDEFIAITTREIAESNPSAFDAERLVLEHTLGGLALRTANEEVSAIADVFLGIEEFVLRDLISAAVVHENTLDQLEDVSSNPDGVEELSDDRNELSPFLDDWAASGPATPEAVSLEPALYNVFVGLLVERLAYLELVEEFTAEAAREIVMFAVDVADQAERDNRQTFLGLLAVGLGVLVFELGIVRGFARPLRRLHGHAERIGDGDLAVEPLPVDGPSDLRRVTAAMNDMSGTLVAVDAQLQNLAAGDDDAAPDGLPGPVGESLRDSVGRLRTLTSDLRESEERLQDEARHDGLTGLHNRFGAVELLDRRLTEPTTALAVLIVDLDGFKNVNDTNGQTVGDGILRDVAERLRSEVGSDDVIARIGGDEFLVIASSCPDEESTLDLGARLIEAIEVPHSVDELQLTLTASVGAQMVSGETTAMRALEGADAAVYHAKRRGRGRVEMYDAELQATIERDAEVEFALRRGVVDGELRLHLQPTVDSATGRFVGAEALVRWERPGAGLLPPAEFIPIAERSGLIIEVGRWVLATACARIAAWRERDSTCSMRLAINVSGRHLAEGDLIADLDDALTATGADPRLLEFELTESHLLDDIGRMRSILASVRGRGVTVAVDDFGTGYSSMTYLQQLPLDAVKIDQAFVARAPHAPFDATVVESIVRIAGALSLDVIAEGIEEPEQLRLVRSLGAHRLQGFALARPMPIDDAEELLFDGSAIDLDRLEGG